MKALREFIEENLFSYGMLELNSGFYLYTKEMIIEEQKRWNEHDECKNFDFSAYEFWLLVDDKGKPEGFDSYDEAIIEYLR
jgi:hypothetical protein